MGTFERIRKVSPYALGVFVVVFIGFMVISDIDFSNIVGQGQNPAVAPIGKVNGEEFLYREFEERVRQQIEQQRNQSGNPDEEIDENQIRAQVWDQMISEVLMRQEAEKIGVRITDAEIADILIETPPDFLAQSFTDSAGVFNRQLYLELITNPENIVNYMGVDPTQMDPAEREEAVNNFRQDLINISNYLRSQKLNEALSSAVSTSGSKISPLFAKHSYRDENSIAEVRYIHVDAREMPAEEITVSDEEIKKYFEENKRFYHQKDERKIKFVSIPIVSSAEDTSRADRRVQKIFEDLQKGTDITSADSIFDIKMSEFSGVSHQWQMMQDLDPQKVTYFANAPERQVVGPVKLHDGVYFFRLDGRRSGENIVARASHILIGFGENNNKDSARSEANNLLRKIRGGEDFSVLAMTASEDKGSAANGGDLGYFGRGRMVKPFEDAVFGANVGAVVGPVESQFGYHIIQVSDKKSDELSFSEIRISPSISNPTKNAIYMSANSIVKQAQDGVPFDSLAKRLGLQVDSSDFMPKAFPIFGSWALTNTIFDAEIGTVLEPKEMQQSGIVIVQVVDERKSGNLKAEYFEADIRQKLTKRKQIEKLQEKAQLIYNEVVKTGDLANAAEYDVRHSAEFKNNGSVPGIGMDMSFTAQVFEMETGTIHKPIRGESGWYIVQVYSKQIPNDEEISSQISNQIMKLKQTAKSNAFNNWFGKIKENAKIEDYRSRFYQEF